MRVFHVHMEAKRYETRRAILAELSRLGEVRRLEPLEFCTYILATEETQVIVESLLNRYLDPGDTLAVKRMQTGMADVLPDEDREWVEERLDISVIG